MVIIIKKETPEAAIRQLLAQLTALHVKGGCVAGEEAILLPLVGETWRLDPNALQALPFVREVRRLTPPYRLAGRAAHPADTVVAAGDARIGGTFCFIAGPCAVESAPQIAAVARSVKAAGAQVLRGGVFKPRTSPYTFQGLGAAGIELLVQAGRDAGLPVITEITDAAQLPLLEDVDILQVGARNMQNYASIPVLKRATHLPVLVDPSHAAGRSELVLPLALAAAAAGADGLMVEVHDRPACALSDGGQSLTCRQFQELTKAVAAILPHAWRPEDL